MAILSWKWACIIKAFSCTHVFLRNAFLSHLSQLAWALSFAPMRRQCLAKDKKSQWYHVVVPQYHICVQIFLGRIQAFPLLREVCTTSLSITRLWGMAFTLLYLVFLDFCISLDSFLGTNTDTFACSSPKWACLVSLQPPGPTIWGPPLSSLFNFIGILLLKIGCFERKWVRQLLLIFSCSLGLIQKWYALFFIWRILYLWG